MPSQFKKKSPFSPENCPFSTLLSTLLKAAPPDLDNTWSQWPTTQRIWQPMSSVQICLPVCLLNCLPAWLPACVSVCLSACLSVCLSACLWNLSKQIENMFEWRVLVCSAMIPICQQNSPVPHPINLIDLVWPHIPVFLSPCPLYLSEITHMHATLHRQTWTLLMGCQIRCVSSLRPRVVTVGNNMNLHYLIDQW